MIRPARVRVSPRGSRPLPAGMRVLDARDQYLAENGFTVEGYARDYLRIDGRWEDHILTAIVNPNWGD